MKKVTILTMVLGMTSLSCAGLRFKVIGPHWHFDAFGSTYDVVLINDTPFEGAPIWGGLSASIPNATVAGPAWINDSLIPGSWTIQEYGFDPNPVFWWTITNTVPGVGTTGSGELLRIRLHTTGVDSSLIELWNTNSHEVLASVEINQGPEPCTVLLFAFGGLALRFRRT